jgi:pyruvate,orthophosphate dikinase
MAHLNEITTPSKYEILREAVKDYPGILSTIDPLMKALQSDPKDWEVIVRETRAYALKNFYLHEHHDKGIEIIRVIIDILMEAIRESEIRTLQQTAVDSLMFYLNKILLDSDQDIKRYALIFQDSFERLNLLQEKQFFYLITSPHQLKKLGQAIWKNSSLQSSFDSLNKLIAKSLIATYTYWLKEENPLQWFKQGTDKTIASRVPTKPSTRHCMEK